MGRVRELGSAEDVVEIARPARLGAARCSTSRTCTRPPTARFTSRRAVRRGARAGRRRARSRARRSTSTSRTSSSQTATRRSTSPTARGRCGPSRSPRRSRGFARPATVISESPDPASTAGDPRDPRRVGSPDGADPPAKLLETPPERVPARSWRQTVADFCEPIDVIRTGLRRADRGHAATSSRPSEHARRRLRARRAGRRERGGRPGAAPGRRPRSTRRCRRRSSGGRLQLPRARRDRGLGGEGAARLLAARSDRRMLDPAAFKAYDVRASTPSQLDEAGAYAIGRAFVEQFEPRRIAVGRDMRLSSPAIAEAVIDGRRRRRRRRRRSRHGRHGDGLLRDRRARARRRRSWSPPRTTPSSTRG